MLAPDAVEVAVRLVVQQLRDQGYAISQQGPLKAPQASEPLVLSSSTIDLPAAQRAYTVRGLAPGATFRFQLQLQRFL